MAVADPVGPGAGPGAGEQAGAPPAPPRAGGGMRALTLATLFAAVSVAGPLLPNATTLALESQGHAIGAASACIGLLQTIFGAFIPPVVSLLGVTPQLMGVSMAIAAVLCLVPLLAIPRAARA